MMNKNAPPNVIGGAFFNAYPEALCVQSGNLRHTEMTTYGCFLPDLTRFMGSRCAEPDVTEKPLHKRYFSFLSCLSIITKRTS